jgi:hypothetical protein
MTPFVSLAPVRSRGGTSVATYRDQSEGEALRCPGSEGKMDGSGFLWEKALWESCAPALPVWRASRRVSPTEKSRSRAIESHVRGQGEYRY